MHNYNIAVKGEYTHKQTSDFLKVVRYLILRKKHTRYLLLDFENLNANQLTAVSLQIDQFDARGNSLGVVNVTYDGVNAKQGRFVLKEKIEMHHACVDFFVKIVYAEYGDLKYCLGDNDTYVVYDKKIVKKPVSKATIKKEVGEEGHVSAPRVFTAPKFLRFFAVVILAAVVFLTFMQLINFKENEKSFFLSNVLYEFVDENNRDEGADVIVTGYAGYGGGDLVIPSKVEGYNVVKIKADAFRDNNIIKSLKINGNVVIEDNAFAGCGNLRSIELNGVENIGANAFYNCTNVSTIKIQDGVNIGFSAFEGCNSVSTLNISANDASKVLNLGNHAFANMGYVAEVTINQYLFYGVDCDYFYQTGRIDTLKLKNFNYIAYEAPGNSNLKPITALFGETSYVSVSNLTIDKTDTIPDDFAKGVNTSIQNVKIGFIEDGKVGDNAFNDCWNLVEFTAPEILEVGDFAFCNTRIKSFNASQLSKIGEYAFANCSELVEFDLASNLLIKDIPEYAFLNTYNLTEAYFSDKIKSIGKGAYAGSGIKKVTFASNSAITEIEEETFLSCTNLTEIIFPKKLEVIKKSAFEACQVLTKLELPSSVTEIGQSAFSGCHAITSVTLPSELLSIKTEAFFGCKAIKSIDVPNNVTEIGQRVFYGCEGLVSISVPFFGSSIENPKAIGYLFGSSEYLSQQDLMPKGLVSVEIKNAEIIPEGAFYGCKALKTVKYPNQITHIGNSAFALCNNLRSVTLPSTLQLMGSNVFVNCYKLFEVENYSNLTVNIGEAGAGEFALAVYNSEDAPRMEKVTVDGFIFGNANGKWYLMENAEAKTLVLPSTVNDSKYYVPSYFYYETEVDELVLSDGIIELGLKALQSTKIKKLGATGGDFELTASALTSNNLLEEVDFASLEITELSVELFAGNPVLYSVILPSSLVKIGEGAFRNCYSLSAVVIPSTVEEISAYAFESCAYLSVDFSKIDNLKKIGEYAFNSCQSLTSVNLPYGVVELGNCAFYSCFSVTTVNLPNTIQKVGQSVFVGCDNIIEITTPFLGETPTNQGVLGYYFGSNDYVYQNVPRTLTKVTLTIANVIKEHSFAYVNSLTTVVLPNDLQEIPNYAFYNATNLSDVEFPLYLTKIGNYAFSNCYSLREISLPETLTSIGNGAFNNVSIETFNAPSQLKTIGDSAFYGCYELENASFANVTHIGSNAFAYNTNLKAITLPSTLKRLGSYAFEGCSNLSVVELSYGITKTTTFDANAFNNCTNLHQVYDLTSSLMVSAGSEDYGKVAYYAVVVNTYGSAPRLQTETVNGVVYKYNNSVCAVVGFDGYENTVTLSSVTLGGRKYTSYVIARYAFGYSYYHSISKLVITDAVTQIKEHAFVGTDIPTLVFNGASIDVPQHAFDVGVNNLVFDSKLKSIKQDAFTYVYNVCYKGSESDYINNPYRYYYSYQPKFFYSSCIHSHNHGSAWNYDEYNGSVNFSFKSYEYRILKQPTCEDEGKGEYYCNDCGYSRTEILYPTGHWYVDYICYYCGDVEDVNVNGYNSYLVEQSLLTVINDDEYNYDLFGQDVYLIKSTNVEPESVSTLTVSAKRNITLTFGVAVSEFNVGTIKVTVGNEEYTYSGMAGKYYTFELKSGQSVEIKFTRSQEETEGFALIGDIQIT